MTWKNRDEIPITNAIKHIFDELNRAKAKWPDWPTDPIHAAAVVSEEAGELTRAANRFVYEDKPMEEMAEEAVQVGAMAVRFLENLSRYKKHLTE